MDNRKIKVTKSPDGRTTITRNKFGSGYKKESILQSTSINVNDLSTAEKSEASRSSKDAYDPEKLIEGIENRIFEFLDDRDLPTEHLQEGIPFSECGSGVTFKRLSNRLKDEHADVIGVTQASNCLFEIDLCRTHISKDNYQAGMSHALRLVSAFQLFTFALLEPIISLGESRQDKLVGGNTKLTNEQYDQCFKYYESLDKTEDLTRSLNKSEKWIKTKEFAKDKFNKQITEQSLRKTHAQK